MFSSFLCASLVALIASVVAVSATPSLTIKTLVPNVLVDELENLKVITTVTNTGDETLKLLNDPRGALSSFPEDTFSITDATGSRPSFNGVKVGQVWPPVEHVYSRFPSPPLGQVQPDIRCRPQ